MNIYYYVYVRLFLFQIKNTILDCYCFHTIYSE